MTGAAQPNNPNQVSVQLPSDTNCSSELWQSGHAEPAWPVPLEPGLNSNESWNHWVQEWELGESIGWGMLRFLQYGHRAIGFITLKRIDTALLSEDVTGIEGGTYIAPKWRGKGFNRIAKQISARIAFLDMDGDWLIYAVPAANNQAAQSLRKLLPELHSEELYTQFLCKWWRYVEWKYNAPFRVFAAHLKSPEAGELLKQNRERQHYLDL